MAALTAAAILTAVAATAGTVASIESSADQRRSANQDANGLRKDAEDASKAKAFEDQAVMDRKAAALARDNQRRRIATGGVTAPQAAGAPAAPGATIGSPAAAVGPTPAAGSTTMLGL